MKTPFRVSLFGGGSDYPEWFRHNGGQVLSTTIDKYCYLTARIPFSFFPHNYRVIYSKIETVSSFDTIKHPVIRECIRKYAPNVRLELHHDADLPSGTGIGSSSAFTVALIHALYSLKGIKIDSRQLASEAIHIEHDVLKENVGWQDQISCALGGINFIRFGLGNTWRSFPVASNSEQIKTLFSRLVLVYTGKTRFSSIVSRNHINQVRQQNTTIYRLMTLAEQAKQILETNGDLDQIGGMLDLSWNLKKALNPNSTNDLIDQIYSMGMKSGASGGKVIGAGGGGFILFYLPGSDIHKFEAKLKDFTVVPVGFSPLGSTSSNLNEETNGF